MTTAIPARWLPLAITSFAAGALILAFGYLSEDEGRGNDDAAIIPLVVVLVVSAAIGVVLWRQLGHRAGRAALTPAIVLAGLSVVTGLLYWTGLAYVLAPVGVALGLAAGDGRGRAAAAACAVALAFAVVFGAADSIF